MSAPVHEIDYAPPRRRPAWLTWRAVFIAIVMLAAAGAAWITVPRIARRGELLRAQEALLENRAALPAGALVSDLTWMGSRPAVMMSEDRVPELEAFAGWGLGQPWWRAAFAGGRDAGSGRRILLIQIDQFIYGSGRSPEITVEAWIFEPGGWMSPPTLVHQTATGPIVLPVPADSGWRLAVLPGTADPNDSARFLLELEAGYAQTADTRRLSVVGRLLPDDTVRFDWPTESSVVD